jgi:hypothetical protein
MKRVNATAKLTCVVELPVGSSWGDDCIIDQVYRQAAEEGKRRLQEAVSKIGGRVIGEPEVTAIMAERG